MLSSSPTKPEIIVCMKSLGIFEEAIHVQVSKGYGLTGETAVKPMNPILYPAWSGMWANKMSYTRNRSNK